MFLFFCLDAKEPKNQGYTPEATNSRRSAEIPETRASRSNSWDFLTLRLEFALRLFR
jgi:hypothetical protein